MPAQPPLLLIAFNRTDTLGEVLRALEPVAPPRVYVAADGPRKGREGEAERLPRVQGALGQGQSEKQEQPPTLHRSPPKRSIPMASMRA